MKGTVTFMSSIWNDMMKPNGKYSRKSWSWVVGIVLFVVHANYAVFVSPSLLELAGFIELLLLYVGMSGFWGVMQYMTKKNIPGHNEYKSKDETP
jgi:uncharacterized membrane protein YhaH (DUF805 family)